MNHYLKFLSIIFFAFSSQLNANSISMAEGIWKTEVKDSGKTKQLVFTIKRNQFHQVVAYLDAPDDGWMRIPGDFSFKEKKMVLDMKMIGSRFEGELKYGGKLIEGVFNYQGAQSRVKLKKISVAIMPPPETYQTILVNPKREAEFNQLLSNYPVDFLSETSAKKSLPFVNALLVLKDEKLIFERYYNGLNSNHQANVKSVNKSILSILTGIALKRGLITNLDQKVLDILPEYQSEQLDKRAYEITIKHLLSMRAGFDFNEMDFYPPGQHPIYDSADWVEATLKLSFKSEPGTRYTYATPQTHLLSAVLSKVAGTSTLEFARKHLFDPFEIRNVKWTSSPTGINFGGSEMWMTPRDMMLIGRLYLNDGKYKGQQIVSKAWINRSLNGDYSNSKISANDSYGFLWKRWTINGVTAYRAAGVGGQYIIIIPDLDAVIVTTANPRYLSGVEENSRAIMDYIEEEVVSKLQNNRM